MYIPVVIFKDEASVYGVNIPYITHQLNACIDTYNAVRDIYHEQTE